MSEPITLHDGAGNTLTVYTRSQAENLLRGGQWYATEADAKAGRSRNEPTPTTAAKLDSLEPADAAPLVTVGTVVSEAEAESDAAPPAPTKSKRPAKGKGGL